MFRGVFSTAVVVVWCVCCTLVFRGVVVFGCLLYSCVSWGVFTAVVVFGWSVVLLCFVGCFHSSSSVWVVCCTLVFRGVFSQQ